MATDITLSKVALQAGVLGGIWASARALRLIFKKKADERVLEGLSAVQRHGMKEDFVQTLSEIGRVCPQEKEAKFVTLISTVAGILEQDLSSTRAAQWHISRDISVVSGLASDICTPDARSSRVEDFQDLTDCMEVTVPMLVGQMDDLLHNHLLKMRMNL